MKIRGKKRSSKHKRDGLQIRTIPGTQRGVFYTKSTLAEQRSVLRLRECTHCRCRLNRTVLVGEELCTLTATDKYTGISHKDGLAGPSESNSVGPIYAYSQVMHAHMNQSIHKWALSKGLSGSQSAHIGLYFGL